MKRILVSGGCGFVGINLVSYLEALGCYEVSVIDNLSLGRKEYLGELSGELIIGDITNKKLVTEAMTGKDCVVHLAADTRVIDSIENPLHNFNNNVVGTYVLLEAAVKAGVKQFINASTGGAILGDAIPPVNEDMVAKPLSPYGASKLASEGYCSAFSASYGIMCTSLRFSNLFGPGSFHKGSVVADFFKRILRKEKLTVYGDGTQVRDYLYIKDLTAAIEKSLSANVYGVFQLGSGKPTELNSLIKLIKETVSAEYSVEVDYKPARFGEVYKTWCDISKAKTQLGFEPKTPLSQGLKNTWSWFFQHYKKDMNPK